MDTYITLMILKGHLMRLPLTKLENIELIIITTPPLPSPLLLLFLVRPGGYTVNLCAFYFTSSSRNWPFLCSFRSSVSLIHQWPVPLQTRGVLLVAQEQSRQHSRQGCSTEDHPERWWHTCGIQITHSPITLTNLSIVNLVFIFRCSSPSFNPVYVRSVNPSALAFSLSSHRHSYISLLFTFLFIDS